MLLKICTVVLTIQFVTCLFIEPKERTKNSKLLLDPKDRALIDNILSNQNVETWPLKIPKDTKFEINKEAQAKEKRRSQSEVFNRAIDEVSSQEDEKRSTRRSKRSSAKDSKDTPTPEKGLLENLQNGASQLMPPWLSQAIQNADANMVLGTYQAMVVPMRGMANMTGGLFRPIIQGLNPTG